MSAPTTMEVVVTVARISMVPSYVHVQMAMNLEMMDLTAKVMNIWVLFQYIYEITF